MFVIASLLIFARSAASLRSSLFLFAFLLFLGFLLGHLSMIQYQANLLKFDALGGTLRMTRNVGLVLALAITGMCYQSLNTFEAQTGKMSETSLYPKTVSILEGVNGGIKTIMKKEQTLLDLPASSVMELMPTNINSMLGLSNVDPAVLRSPQVQQMIVKAKKDMENQVLSSVYEVFSVPEANQKSTLKGAELVSYKLSSLLASNFTFFKIEVLILCLFLFVTLFQLYFGILGLVSAILFFILTKIGLYELKLGMVEKQFLE